MNKILVVIFVELVGAFSSSSDDIQNSDNASEISDYSTMKLIKFNDLCGETLTESQFLLESFNYPEEYLSNLNCELTLQGQNCPLYYKFRFLDFDVENSTGCVKDRLEIDQTDALCGRRNGTETYFAKNGTLKLLFVTDAENAGRGYQILITRIEECLNETVKFPETVSTSVGSKNNFNPNLKKCDLSLLENSHHFFVKSPNFPSSMSSPNDCSIHIKKSSTDICRLRIRFKFFWFGNSLDCKEGFLQIDGKLICGCKKELNLMSPFLENVKIFRFRSEGIVSNSYSGFIAEIFQDVCPKKVESASTTLLNQTSRSAIEKSEKLTYYSGPQEVADVYYFEYPDQEILRKEREDVNYFETENINRFLGNNVYEYNSCLQWNQIQFDNAFAGKETTSEQCKIDRNKIVQEQSCLKFFQRKGFFFSPGYPFFYPGKLNMCYRFLKVPGYCGVKIHFLDFRVGSVNDCSQDHIEIGTAGSFCGMNLWNKIVYLDLSVRDFVDMYFITKYLKCAQGFKAIYEQIPCNDVSTDRPSPSPLTKIWTLPPPTTLKPPINCDRSIRSKSFTIMNEEDSLECTFTIEKYSEDVCRLILDFEHFFSNCSIQYLTINGQRYCGNQSGKRVYINFEYTTIKIQFSKSDSSSIGLTFKISGVQDSTDCITPPAQLTE